MIEKLALAALLISTPTVAFAEMMTEVEAARTDVYKNGSEVVWTSSGVARPQTEMNNDKCYSFPEYTSGMYCYRLCGGSLKSIPKKWTVKWRASGYGDGAAFYNCSNETQCRGFNAEYYSETSRGCITFGLWRGAHPRDKDADLRAIIELN